MAITLFSGVLCVYLVALVILMVVLNHALNREVPPAETIAVTLPTRHFRVAFHAFSNGHVEAVFVEAAAKEDAVQAVQLVLGDAAKNYSDFSAVEICRHCHNMLEKEEIHPSPRASEV